MAKVRSLSVVAAMVAAVVVTGGPARADVQEAVDGSYLVVLKDPGADAAALAGKYDGRVRKRFRHALSGFSAQLTVRDARRLAADPAVAQVRPNRVVRATTTQTYPPSWGLDRVDQRTSNLDHAYTYTTTASNVTAYVIDTGIYPQHTDFGGRASWGTNTIGDGKDVDCHGHGTHVAGTVGGTRYGVAKGVKLVGVKVLGCDGSGTVESVVAGIDWVIAHHVSGPAVANLSLGGDPDTVLDDAIRRLIADGVTTAVSAGNDNDSACLQSPARVTEAITVGSVTDYDQRSDFSNFGPCVDVFAPGSYITSAWSTWSDASRSISGTSMASPHVAGAAALLLSVDPSTTPAQISAHIGLDATQGAIPNPGTGSPNRLLVVGTGSRPGYPIVSNPGYRAQRTGTPMTIQMTAGGGTAPYAWSATGLPTGVTINATTGLISGVPTQTLVNGAITVTAKDKNNRAGQVRFEATVVPPNWTCPTGGQKFVNPGFESGTTGWWEDSWNIDQHTGPLAPRTGTWAAALQATTSLGYTVTQTVEIPRECAWSTLTFWAKFVPQEGVVDDIDALRVQTDDEDLLWLNGKDAGTGYRQYTVDISRFAGTSLRLWFKTWGDYKNTSTFVIDDLSLNAR